MNVFATTPPGAGVMAIEEQDHSSAPWDQLHQAQLRKLRSLHGELVTLELARMGLPIRARRSKVDQH